MRHPFSESLSQRHIMRSIKQPGACLVLPSPYGSVLASCHETTGFESPRFCALLQHSTGKIVSKDRRKLLPCDTITPPGAVCRVIAFFRAQKCARPTKHPTHLIGLSGPPAGFSSALKSRYFSTPRPNDESGMTDVDYQCVAVGNVLVESAGNLGTLGQRFA